MKNKILISNIKQISKSNLEDLFNTDALTVSELTREIKLTLEDNFSRVSVIGEISNFKDHVSGHWYFNLKDSDAVINCTMWRGFNNYVYFTPQDGMKVVVNGKVTIYPPRGTYQIDVRSMQPAGLGELQEAFEKLKRKLEDEGLFDEEHKKSIPLFPEKIGIVTAIDGAAFRDMISVAERRFPLTELVIAPARVQGSGAAKTIAKSISDLNQLGDIDVIIVGRGGGSIEDLWAFNEEIVARAIYNAKIPVISGVGHEVDTTIADYVADLRAPTPSVAMELATPNIEDILVFLSDFIQNSVEKLEEKIFNANESVKSFTESYAFRSPTEILRMKQQKLDFLISNLSQGIDRKFLFYKNKISLLSKTVDNHDVQKTLKRGFVLVKQNSKFIQRAKSFNKNEPAELNFSDGKVKISS